MNKDLKWAATTLLEFAKIPATPNFVNAFENPSTNSEWIKSVIKQASPVQGTIQSPYYTQAIDILQQNGINTDIYSN